MRCGVANVWDLRARCYDLCEASDLRRGPFKSALYQGAAGRVLLVAVGTGVDLRHIPAGCHVFGIDISDAMLRRARARAEWSRSPLALVRTDALALCFADESFDTVVCSCTMCSVPDPARALREIYRVLRPGGRLLMFEHVRSRSALFGLALDAMTLFTRRGGTEMNRDTLAVVTSTGFRVERVESVFLDIMLAVRAAKPRRPETRECPETAPA